DRSDWNINGRRADVVVECGCHRRCRTRKRADGRGVASTVRIGRSRVGLVSCGTTQPGRDRGRPLMLVAVCSLKGSPGVTTLATALGARWPGRENPIVVEVDPAGGDLMARFRLPDTPGLVSLAAAARGRGQADQDLVTQHTQLLPGGLRVVLGPVGAEQARA